MIRTTHLFAAGLFAIALPTTSALAVEANIEASARAFLEETVADWMADSMVVDAIKAQNAAHADLDAAAIDVLDQAWIAEADNGGGALFQEMIARDTSVFLIESQDSVGGEIVEMWIMDNHGLNVAQTALTGDYNQGDEDKWLMTYPMGPGAVHVEEVEFDEHVQAYVVKASMTVVDPATGEAIGAVTVGINAEFLL